MVLTGTSNIHTDSVSHLRMLFKCYNTPLLNELRGGDFQGLKPSEVKALYPFEYQKRFNNKFDYRLVSGLVFWLVLRLVLGLGLGLE
jgi:broad specificity phosphatase PhoE